jgi:hypothetical protein
MLELSLVYCTLVCLRGWPALIFFAITLCSSDLYSCLSVGAYICICMDSPSRSYNWSWWWMRYMKVPICEVDIYIVAGSESEVKKRDTKNLEPTLALDMI